MLNTSSTLVIRRFVHLILEENVGRLALISFVLFDYQVFLFPMPAIVFLELKFTVTARLHVPKAFAVNRLR